jgi:hypothetical protein
MTKSGGSAHRATDGNKRKIPRPKYVLDARVEPFCAFAFSYQAISDFPSKDAERQSAA